MNRYDIRHNEPTCCYEIYDTTTSATIDVVFYTDPYDRLPREYISPSTAKERALHRAQCLDVAELADNAPSASPDLPALVETFTPAQFPSVEATITPTSVIEWHDATVNGRCTAFLMVDGKLHELAAWMVGAPDYRAYRQCEDVLEAALQVRDRLQRAEFEQQVAADPPAPIPATRIEYNGEADLFVAYVDGAEVTAAPTQAALHAALDRVTLGDVSVPAEMYARWRRVLSEEQIDAMFRAAFADAVESIDDWARAADVALESGTLAQVAMTFAAIRAATGG